MRWSSLKIAAVALGLLLSLSVDSAASVASMTLPVPWSMNKPVKPPKNPPPSMGGLSHVLWMDFDGDPGGFWNQYKVPATPAYPNLAAVPTIVAGVQAYFRGVNLTVTSTPTAGAYHMVVGGNGSWIANGSGDTFIDSAETGPFEDFVFSSVLSDDPISVIEVAAHEYGHSLGLQHQSVWKDGVKTQEYNPGDASGAPLMGNPLGRSLDQAMWWKGTNSLGVYQDDFAIIESKLGPAAAPTPEPPLWWGLGFLAIARRRR